MARHLGALTVKAVSGPFGNVLLHARPDEFGCDRFLGHVDAGMTKAMNCVKNSSAPGQRYPRPSGAVRRIYYETVAIHVNCLEMQTRSGILGQSRVFWVERLFLRHLAEIHVETADAVDDRLEI